MYDAKVMHEPCAPHAMEAQCTNDACRARFIVLTMKRGARCPVCQVYDPHNKIPRRLVKP